MEYTQGLVLLVHESEMGKKGSQKGSAWSYLHVDLFWGRFLKNKTCCKYFIYPFYPFWYNFIKVCILVHIHKKYFLPNVISQKGKSICQKLPFWASKSPILTNFGHYEGFSSSKNKLYSTFYKRTTMQDVYFID